ncbi:replication protein RepA [Novosphingobium sp. PhB57]|uniref:replication protein RepA n=1 Tax=Novosphingobium sp. PhB57 TaxID=2485107 RepID=UPI001404719E|nr:replication protein RepA [Novosphingobium sp. PhB57]
MARRKTGDADAQIALPLGARFVDALTASPAEEVRALAETAEAKRIFDAVRYVMEEESLPNFMHSALCAMSLPVKAPKDPTAPVIRRDGNISLIIQPMERQEPNGPGGEFVSVNRGVPYGRHARLIMIYIMTEAVRTRTREIYLGSSFSSWLRRMGITNTSSGGKRGTRTSVQDQIDRILNCQWTIRWDDDVADGRGKRNDGRKAAVQKDQMRAFAVNDMRIVNQYAGLRTGEGSFVSHFVLSEEFYNELLKHSVPFNERAIVALKDSATKLDLYTWLAYRLPRIPQGTEVRLSWQDLAKHLGNQSSTMTKFRQSVRAAWEEVSGVYQQARHSVDLSDLIIKLRHAEKPIKGMLLVQAEQEKAKKTVPSLIEEAGMLRLYSSGKTGESSKPIRFPATGSLEFSEPELYRIGRDYGSNNSVSIMADAFRRALGGQIDTLEGDVLKDRWKKYVERWKAPS